MTVDDARRDRRLLLGYAGAAGVLALATAVGWAFHVLRSPDSTVVMTYLLGVIVVAGLFGRGPAVASSVGAVLLYNVLFTPPYFTVHVDDVGHLHTFAMMLVVAITVSELTARIRARLELSGERERRLEALYRVSQRLAAVAGKVELARAAEELLSEIFPGEVALFLPTADGLAPAREHGFAARPEVLQAARGVLGQERPAGGASPSDAGALFVPLVVPGRRVGVLAWLPAAGSPPLGPEGRRLLDAVATLVALALERDRFAEEGHRAQAEAAAEKVRSGLLSGLSHDLRTPLAAITGSASALLQAEEPDAPTRRALAQTVHGEADRLARFVEKVLQMTRLQAGRLKVDAQWQPLDEVIGSALSRLERALGEREVTLRVPSPAPLVHVDGLLIEQVLVNLVENALAHAPGSPLEVGAALTPAGVEVWVADRGPGVAAEDRERVFDMFFRRAGRREPGAQRGVGLGLAICRALVQAHGGALRVVENHGGGARFVFTLPRGAPPPGLEARELEALEGRTA